LLQLAVVVILQQLLLHGMHHPLQLLLLVIFPTFSAHHPALLQLPVHLQLGPVTAV
jgi:hypothetical protein